MRIVTWMLMGIGAGALAGFVSALLRRRHHHIGEPVVEYAGGYTAPVASEDHTAIQPAKTVLSDISPSAAPHGATEANGNHRIDQDDEAFPTDRDDRVGHVGRVGHAGRGGHG